MRDFEKMIYEHRIEEIKEYLDEILGENLTIGEVLYIIMESFYKENHIEIEKFRNRKRAKKGKN